MSEYTFQNIQKLNPGLETTELLSTGVHIILFNPTTPPPHLLLLVHGSVFSISVSGPRVDWALSELIKMVERRKIPTLFISLEKPESLLIKNTSVKELIHDLIMVHPGVVANEASCLFPIMEFCKTVYNIDISKVKVIFDLLDQLEDGNVIHKLSHLNMGKWVVDEAFHIERYGEDEVNKMINNMKK
ncbi:MAG: hypothetical protein JKY18_04815 [Flavobacteriales bacterium]|nr:hypothetical protein [Flavobacteriales bacterium]MBL4734658.1 hypothetical protein [Flavobacteriales bacterium]